MKITHYLSILAIVAIAASCSKGDTGPAGPQGLQGNAGLNGAANIVVNTYTVTSWSDPSNPYHWIVGFTDTNITANNVDVVNAYWNTTLGSGWTALPNPSVINPEDNLSFKYNDDSVYFTYYTGGDSIMPPSHYSNLSTIIFKVTVIPPALGLKYPGTNLKNATEAAKLPEVQAALNAK